MQIREKGKETIENTQLFALGMKLARFSNSSHEKEDFVNKAEKLWDFLANKTGILNTTTFQVKLFPPFSHRPYRTLNLGL